VPQKFALELAAQVLLITGYYIKVYKIIFASVIRFGLTGDQPAAMIRGGIK
jgi:hypothetical protein